MKTNSDWKSLLCRRLMSEAWAGGCCMVDVCCVRMMRTRPRRMYAVVVEDGFIHVLTGANENEMALGLNNAMKKRRASI